MLRPIARFDAAEFGSPLAGEVPGRFERDARVGEALATEFALDATREALQHAGLATEAVATSTGLVLGTCLGESEVAFRCLRAHTRRIPDSKALPGERFGGFAAPSTRLAEILGLGGPVLTLSSACASGTAATGMAADCIRRGECDVMLACGVEILSRFVVSGFWLLRALASGPVRPFDRRRDGLALGEGAGVLVLEERDHALERGARVLAEVMGSGSSGDAHHMTGPSPTGDGMVRAIRGALQDARLGAEAVGFISAHGTATPYNDRMESIAIKRVFGERAFRIPVISIKPIVGHTLGASGALEAILSIKVLREGIVPPTINYREPDPECDLDYVPNRARSHAAGCAMSCSSAFAGHNATLLLMAP
jgi:3-oxoacyl-[acyl-carrier-protein] synthase II